MFLIKSIGSNNPLIDHNRMASTTSEDGVQKLDNLFKYVQISSHGSVVVVP